MASKQLAKGLKRSALTAALGLCFVGGAYAQSNSAGAVTGSADPGDTITISNPERGFSRTVTVGADGNYRFSSLPTGTYQISENGGAPRNVTVNVGIAANVNFDNAGTATLGTVTVVGSNVVNPIDVSSVESTTILTAEQINKIPVPRNGTAVALLAPGTVRGDSAFGNLASFGGSSVAENQYYLNGFNITNTFANLNFVQVPFEGIAEQQVKTGGYGAEFGRSTGGVLNQITKRGSNEFHAGGNIFWEPESLEGERHDITYLDGELYQDRSQNTSDQVTAALWASGALIRDRLFAYGLVQYGRGTDTVYPGVATGANNYDAETKSPNWLLKLDWNINESNILEFTGMSDHREINTDYYSSSYDSDGAPIRGDYLGTDYTERGGDFYVAKYTGYLTDTFTLSVLAGHGEFSRSNYSVSANGIVNSYQGEVGHGADGCPWIIDSRPGGDRTGCYLATVLGRPDAKDSRDQYRVDAEWQLGDHLLRGGVDIDNFESVAGESYSGGEYWRYYTDTLVRRRVFQSGSTVAVDQTAYYLEDSWNITDDFVAYLGARWDTFENKNGNGETYVKIENQFAPRLGFSWDVFGDSTFKVFGNAGRYALPLTATVAVRGASVSLFSEQFFNYTGVDPNTDAPTGLTPVDGSRGEIRYLNNEFGLAKNPETIASQTLEPMYQDEYILGFQKQLTDNMSMGVRGIYRDLKAAIDDTCDYRPIFQWAYDHGYEVNDVNPGFPYCRLYNPGNDSVYRMDVDGDGTLETIEIGADDVWAEGNDFGIPAGTSVQGPAAKRKYSALEFFFQGNWDKLFLQGSYTYAKSKGNTEGGVKSDIGQDDTGTTQDFDYPELSYGAYGYLPNDRRHTLKLFGNYEFTDEWSAGFNLLVQSGRPVNCFGYLGDYITSRYGNSYFSCDPGMIDDMSDNGSTIVPRGSAGTTPWQRTLDLNVAYRPSFVEGLMFKVDVFNVFNAQSATTLDEFGEDGIGRPTYGPNCGNPDLDQAECTYGRATGYQAPRAVRFMIQYDF